GVSLYSFSAEYPTNSYLNFSSNSEIGYFLGFEAEVFMPIKNNKWSVFVSPALATKSFQTLSERGPFEGAEKVDAEMKLTTLEAPMGIRYYTFLNSESSLRVSLGFAPNVAIGESAMYYESNTESVTVASPWEFGTYFDARLGIGYEFRNISFDFSHYIARGMLTDAYNTAWKTQLTTSSFRLAYKIK
ncbi:MAG: outer membrane beta-barrel protein, partial [Candidatus Kapaibacterium sp.]